MEDKLEAIITFNSKNNKYYQWKEIERDMNYVFPEDYKNFINKYGEGAINDFFWIMSPFSEYENLNTKKRFYQMKDSYEYMKKENSTMFKYQFFDGNIGLFPWGITDNGDEIYWHIQGGIKSTIVIYAARYSEVKEYDMTATEFLFKILNKEFVCPIFPDDFICDENYFEL